VYNILPSEGTSWKKSAHFTFLYPSISNGPYEPVEILRRYLVHEKVRIAWLVDSEKV